MRNPYVGTVSIDGEQTAFEAIGISNLQSHHNIGIIIDRGALVSILRENRLSSVHCSKW